MSKLTDEGRTLLRILEAAMPELYEEIGSHAAYPNEDDFKSGVAHDDAVDLAELKALHELIGVQLEEGK